MQRHSHHHRAGPGSGPRSFGGRNRFGSGLRAAKMLASGDLQLIILLLLSQKPRHGYEIIKAVEEHSSGIYTPSPGVVYPSLTYLEETNYATATSEGTKKLYTLTAEGADHLTKNRSAVDEVWNQLSLYGSKLAHFQKRFAEDESVEDGFGSDPGGQSKNEWQRMKSEFRSLRDELKAAIYEKLDSSLQEKKRILSILRQAIIEIRNGS